MGEPLVQATACERLLADADPGGGTLAGTLGQPGGGNPGGGNPGGGTWQRANLAGATLAGATGNPGGATLEGQPWQGQPGGGATLVGNFGWNLAGQPWRGQPWRGLRGIFGPTSPAGVARRGFRVNPLLHCARWLAGMHQVWQARSAWQSKQISKR